MSVQYCANCGEPVTAGERFCGNCGRDVTVPGSVSNAPPLQPGIPPTAPIHQQDSTTSVITKQSSSTPLLAGVVIILLVLAVGGYFLFANKGSGNNTTNNQANAVSTATPASVAIVNPTSTPASVIVNPTDTPASAIVNPTDTPANAVGNATNTPNQEVSAAVTTMNSLTGFHAKFTGSISNTSLMMEGDFSKDAASYAGRDNNLVFDAIYVNNTGYISTDKGKTWQNDTQHLTVDVHTVYDLLNSISIGNGDTVNDEGQTTLQDGSHAHRLGISESFDTVRITLLTVDFQGKKAVAHLDYSDNTSRIQASIDYSKFNETVTVTAPSVTTP